MIASAPGQIFFFGEHAVVYGKPGIGSAIGLRTWTKVEKRQDNYVKIRSDLGLGSGRINTRGDVIPLEIKKDLLPCLWIVSHFIKNHGKISGVDLEIKSTLPIKSGLSSSSAFIIATYAGLLGCFGKEIDKKVLPSETFPIQERLHGKASGVELFTSTYGGYAWIQKKEDRFDVKKIDGPKLDMVIGDTGVPMATSKMVEKVAILKERWPDLVEGIFDQIERITICGREALHANNLTRIGTLMNVNHGLLSALGVSSRILEDLIWAARKAGAYGAKLTGGGGGKCMIALVSEKHEPIANAIKQAGGIPIHTEIGCEGLKIED
jgi:mevalonate kinase